MTTRPDFSALFTASPYPYLLIDTGFIIIGANPAYLRATGRTADDIVGKNIFDAFPADPNDPGSTNLDEVRVSIERAIATREPHTSALLRYAVPRVTPEGTVFDQRYWSAVHTPVFGADGAVAFVAQNAIDVTDLYRFDAPTSKYYLKPEADAVPDVTQMSGPQMHEAMGRVLGAQRNQLQTLFDLAPGFLCVLSGPEHRYTIANEAYYQLVGQRELIGKTVREALPDVADQGFYELLDQAFGSGQPIVLHERKLSVRRTPGAAPEDRYVDFVYQPIVGTDCRVTGLFVQGNDVTAKHLADNALTDKIRQLEEIRASQALQLELGDRLRQQDDPDAVTAVACELLGRKLGAARVLYADVDDASGTVLIRRDWTAPGLASLAGQTRTMDDFGAEVTAALRAGRTVVNSDVERDPRSAGHSAAYAAIGVRANLLVPYLRAGKLHVVLTVQSDVPRVWEEREQALVEDLADQAWSAVDTAQTQAALRTERDRSQYIFDSMAEGFAVLDSHWTIVRMNAEGLRLTERVAADVIGRNHWDVFPEMMGTENERVYRRVMATGQTEIVEIPYNLRDNSQAWMEVRTHRSLDGGIAFFFRDITERKAAQEALTLADRRKDEFLAMLAHELRNPLAPIGAAADLLQLARLDEAGVRQTSQIIGRQVRHMTSLVDDLLDVSRVTRGLVELHMERLDIRHLVNDAIEQVTPLVRGRNHSLGLQLPAGTPAVMGDKKRLVQVLANLLNNAAKYTPEGGHITLTVDVREGHVLLHVKDSGIGMAPELVERAFDLFTQAERSSDRSLGGLGLGLALVKSLVGLHRGTVHCASAGLGQGSTFTVCLPRMADDAAQQQGAAVDEGVARPAGGKLRIMVVDDNVDAGWMLGMLLEALDHEVVVEHDARMALARSAGVAPDVFLLDIGLPEMDGNELARHLRAQAATARAVLVAVTGYGQEQDRAQTAAAGFDHHLVKPVDMPKLYAILAGLTA